MEYSYPYSFDTNTTYLTLVEQIKSYPDHWVEKTTEIKLMCRVILKRTSGTKLYFLTVNVLGENLSESPIQIVMQKQQ